MSNYNNKPLNKKPVEQKGITRSENTSLSRPLGFFELDPKLQAELDESGLEAHFLSIKNIERNGGYHSRGWRPFKRQTTDSENAFSYGRDTEGYVRRGDLVLGVKTKEEADAQRKENAYLARIQQKGQTPEKMREEFAESLSRGGIPSHLIKAVISD
jgi:hypothetical protein